jgi:hypothetical protein
MKVFGRLIAFATLGGSHSHASPVTEREQSLFEVETQQGELVAAG